ncbi:MAG: hypothetical protein DRQ58_11605 [Gammaproteobacteria bacterium]|nr:MAG: hypothetical protein DRQ58_11605 [Gammaproteobacteria bacterium]
MKGFKFISGILLLCGLVTSSNVYVYAASDGFGRLFTTPEERRTLQVLRYSKPQVEVEAPVELIVEEIEESDEEVQRPDIEGITLNGIVYRKGGKSTVWINDTNSYEGSLSSEYFRIKAGDINSEKVSVTVPEVDLKFDLKVGQTYEPNDESLLDLIEDDMPFIIK